MQHGTRTKPPSPSASLPRQVLDDIRHGNLRREVGRDLTELYGFFLDDEQQQRAATMARPKRWFMVPWWALKSLLRRLAAPRAATRPGRRRRRPRTPSRTGADVGSGRLR